MKKQRVYLDTSAIGGCFDEEFAEDSRKLISEIKAGKKLGVVSEITIRELIDAPKNVRDDFETYKELLEVVYITGEADELSSAYLRERIISETYKNDSLHIALATINQVDVLVSWNFQHIVNLNKIMQFNSVNIRNGYKPLQIYSPKEVIESE